MPQPRNKVALEAELLVARLAVEIVTEEAKRGLSFPGANRPLFKHEIAAHTRFGDLDDATRAAERAIRSVTDPLWSDMADALMRDLMDHSDSAVELAQRLSDLKSMPGAGIPGTVSAIEDAQSKIYRAILQARLDWANATLDEALAQGVDPTTLPETNNLKPTRVEAASLNQRAREVALHPLGRITDVAAQVLAGRDLTQVDPATAIDDMRTAIAATKHDGTDDIARQAVHDGANFGRASVVAEAPKPKYVYASELLDGKTCDPCAHRDGHVYDDVDDAATDYPNGGGYTKCLGGRRCRGTLVYVWPEEAEPSLDDPNAPAPPPPPPPQAPTKQPTKPADPLAREWSPLSRADIDATSDGTPMGDRVARKTKQMFTSDHHSVHIEADMTAEQTAEFLADATRALARFSAQVDTRPITFRVPTGEPSFRRNKNSITMGFIIQGDDTVFVNPLVATGAYKSPGHNFMPAAGGGISTREYTMTHELGHVLDGTHQHTSTNPTVTARSLNHPDERTFWRDHKDGLSGYGKSDPVEGYAEAFAQWSIGGPGSSETADAYAKRYGWN